MTGMLNLLRDIYSKAETLKGPKLIVLVALIFVLFIPLGFIFGYGTKNKLKGSENTTSQNPSPVSQIPVGKEPVVYKSGRIVYVNPDLYPNDGISYALQDYSGNELLLKAKDDKLKVSEGLDVKIAGRLSKTKDGSKEVLLVDEVIISN